MGTPSRPPLAALAPMPPHPCRSVPPNQLVRFISPPHPPRLPASAAHLLLLQLALHPAEEEKTPAPRQTHRRSTPRQMRQEAAPCPTHDETRPWASASGAAGQRRNRRPRAERSQPKTKKQGQTPPRAPPSQRPQRRTPAPRHRNRPTAARVPRSESQDEAHQSRPLDTRRSKS